MLSRLLFRSVTLLAIGGGLAVAHSLIPPKVPIILGDPKAPVRPANPGSGSTPAVPDASNGAAASGTLPATDAGPGLNVSIAESVALFEKGAPFVDARYLAEYEAGHVLNAFHLTVDQLIAGKGLGVLGMMDPAAPVVVYCGGGMCDASKNLVNYLQAAGFAQCHIMNDGYPAWVAAGQPTATGAPEIGE